MPAIHVLSIYNIVKGFKWADNWESLYQEGIISRIKCLFGNEPRNKFKYQRRDILLAFLFDQVFGRQSNFKLNFCLFLFEVQCSMRTFARWKANVEK